MNAQNPVTVVPDNNPETPEDTVITARFNRKKIAKIVGTATAALGALTIFGAVMKTRGQAELIRDLKDNTTEDDTEETTAS